MLFPEMTLRARPTDLRKRNERPMTTYHRRFGHSNVALSELLPVIAPKPKPRTVPYPLEGRDAHGEWLNAEHPSVAHLRRALEELPPNYDASVGYLRARPRQSSPAQQFWDADVSRAHLLNAVLGRGERSVVQVHRDCDLIDDKIYTYLPRWGCHFNKVNRMVMMRDSLGAVHNMHMVEAHADGTATLRLEGYTLTVRARFVRHTASYHLDGPLHVDHATLISDKVAGLLANLTPATLCRVLPPDTHSDTGKPLYTLARLETVLPRQLWRMTLEAALKEENSCQCIFFDHHQGGCGLGNRLPAARTASYACRDHEAAPCPR